MAAPEKKFDPRSRTLADQLLEYVHEKAKENGLIDETTFSAYKKLEASVSQYTRGSKTAEQELKAAIEAASLAPEQKLAISRLLSAQTIVLNALSNQDRARETITPNAYERFKTLFTQGLTGDDPEGFISLLEQAKEKMLISIVETSHPVVYHTPFASDVETKITDELESANSILKRYEPISEGSEQIRNIQGFINGLLGGIKEGLQVTPEKQVTVAQENKVEKRNLKAREDAIQIVMAAYDKALDDITSNPKVSITAAQKERINACKFKKKSPFESRTWVRSADADGRDKSTSIELYKSISAEVTDGKYNTKAPKLDCRENAEIHRNFISALVQSAYWVSKDGHNPAFAKYCRDFCDTNYPEKKPDSAWESADESIFQQLDEEDKTKFLTGLINSDLNLVPPRTKDITLEFNSRFEPLYRQFIDAHWDEIHEKFPLMAKEDVTPDDLHRVWSKKDPNKDNYLQDVPLSNALRNEVSEKMKMRGADGRDHSFRLNEDFSYAFEDGGLVSGYLNRRYKAVIRNNPAGGKPIVAKEELRVEERKKLMDVIKRLYVLDDAVDKYGNAVADRYQIANFEQPSDFYAALLLFKEAGIVQVKDGKIAAGSHPKLSIQPLLETAEDMRNAPKMFENLLKNDLVKSYYEALGNRADIMLGFSDGSKSAGNFASEWNIYKCSRELKKVFAKQGIALRVFQGRGRGPDRGGQFEEGHDQHMLPPEVQEDMKLDVTLQGDKPMDMAHSAAAAQDTLASMVTGTLTAAMQANALQKKKLSGLDAQRLSATYKDPIKLKEAAEAEWKETPEGKSHASCEAAIEFIAQESENEYRRLVSKNVTEVEKDGGTEKVNQALQFVNAMPGNSLISSRKPKRAGTAKADFESTRAITVEYAFNRAAAPLHNIGLQKALNDYIKSGPPILDIDGNQVRGKRALKVLYDSHPFFRGMIDKTIRGMEIYDPQIFANYAKAIGVESWAKECTGELNGLLQLLYVIRSDAHSKDSQGNPLKSSWNISNDNTGMIVTRGSALLDKEQEKRQIKQSARESQALHEYRAMNNIAAQALILSAAAPEKGEVVPTPGIFKPKPKTVQEEIKNNLMFTVAENISHRGIPPEITARVDGQQWVH